MQKRLCSELRNLIVTYFEACIHDKSREVVPNDLLGVNLHAARLSPHTRLHYPFHGNRFIIVVETTIILRATPLIEDHPGKL